MPDAGDREPASVPKAGDAHGHEAVSGPVLGQLARFLLDISTSGDDLFDGGAGGEIAYRMLLELLCHDPRRLSLVELSAAADRPIAEVFRSVNRLAQAGMVSFVGDEPTLREHEIGLAKPGRTRIEQHLRAALSSLSDLLAGDDRQAA